MSNVSFTVSREEARVIHKIVKRAGKHAEELHLDFDFTAMMMDITACHVNGCPLKLDELLDADGFDFAHDVWGIQRHINRKTGKLEDCFLPRFART